VYLTPARARLLAAQLARVEALGRQLEPARIIPYLFPHFTGTATRRPGTRGAVLGEQRTEFRKAWATACKGAGCPGMLRHDFRRTAARNLDRAGVPRSVAMKITGHRTEAVYRRYTITSDADQRDAAVRLGTFLGTPRGGALETRSVKA
jgi:integrase